jgi:hypothetical protein
VRSKCLDHLLVRNERHLERILRSYALHYNSHRPHQKISQEIPEALSKVQLTQVTAGEPERHRRHRPVRRM